MTRHEGRDVHRDKSGFLSLPTWSQAVVLCCDHSQKVSVCKQQHFSPQTDPCTQSRFGGLILWAKISAGAVPLGFSNGDGRAGGAQVVQAARAAASSVGCNMDHTKGNAAGSHQAPAWRAHRAYDSLLAQPVPPTPTPIYTPKGHRMELPASPGKAPFPSSRHVRSRGCLHGNSVASVA